MNITQFTNAELLAELKRREYQQIDTAKPKAVADPDLSDLRQTCQAYIDAVAMRDYVDEDLPHWIFEAALKALYGNNVFDWIVNSRNKK